MKLTSSLAAAMLASLAFTTSTTHASTYTWTGTAAGAYQWTTDANWDVAPASDLDTILNHTSTFAAGVVITSNNDVTIPPFKLNQLSFTNGGPATGTAPALTLTGNQLEFITNTALATPTLIFNTTGAVKPVIDIQNNLLLTNQLGVTATTSGKLSGVISGTGSLTRSGSGTLTLTNTNTYSGGTFISGGTLNIAAANTGGTTANNITFNGTGTFGGTAGITYDLGALAINSGTATIQAGASRNYTFTTLSGTGALMLRGDSVTTTLTVPNASAFTGAIRFQQGTASTFPTLGVKVGSLGDASGAGNIQLSMNNVAKTGTFTLYNDVGPLTLNYRAIELIDGGSDAAIALVNSNATPANTFVINTNLVPGASPYSKKLILQGTNTGNNTFAGVIANTTGASGTVSVTKGDAGKWILSGTNTYSGGTTISGGTLNIATASSLGSSGNLTFSASGTFGGTAGITYNLGALAINSGTATIQAGAATTSRNYTFTTLSGTGALTLRGDATVNTTLTVPDASAFTGAILFQWGASTFPNLGVKVGSLSDASGAGNIKAAINNVAKTATFTLYNDVGPLTLNNRAIELIDGGSDAALALVNSNTNPANTFVINTNLVPGASPYSKKLILQGTNTGNNTFAGVIANTTAAGGTVSVTKADAGKWILSGTNTYTGTTTISGGTLALGASNVLPDTTAVSLGSATLDAATFADTAGTLNVTGTGTIHLGGGSLAFADSSAITWAGTLNITGTFVSGSSLKFGTSNTALTADQLTKITATGFTGFGLSADGHLTATSASGYSTWQTNNSTTGGLDQDHDGDGVSNGVEYFLSGTAITTGFTALPGVLNNSGTLSVTWPKAATYTGTYGTDYVVETSDTLIGTWTTEIADPNPGFTVTFPSATQVKYTFPASSSKRFARLRVTGP